MKITKGYKATNKDMKCRGVQFVLGEWQEVEGELIECKNGFHFSTELAHTYQFYTDNTDRRFECEVVDVLETQEEPGVQSKRVCRKIRLIKELTINGDNNTGCSNTGDKNTGDSNTGDSNTGNWNTGYKNVGNWNTGNRNVGNRNVGNWNTGDSNTGNRNTGDDNTGDNNTGDWNTGDKNTGNRNVGNRNTGSWNHCNCNSGFFGSIDPKVTSFDLPTDYSQSEFWENFSNLIRRLGDLLLSDDPIDVKPFLQIPNITQERLDNLHQKFIKSRQKENEKI